MHGYLKTRGMYTMSRDANHGWLFFFFYCSRYEPSQMKNILLSLCLLGQEQQMTSRIALIGLVTSKTWAFTKIFFFPLCQRTPGLKPRGQSARFVCCVIEHIKERGYCKRMRPSCGRNEPRRASPLQAAPSTQCQCSISSSRRPVWGSHSLMLPRY